MPAKKATESPTVQERADTTTMEAKGTFFGFCIRMTEEYTMPEVSAQVVYFLA